MSSQFKIYKIIEIVIVIKKKILTEIKIIIRYLIWMNHLILIKVIIIILLKNKATNLIIAKNSH